MRSLLVESTATQNITADSTAYSRESPRRAAQTMNQKTTHPVFGALVLQPESWRWTGSFVENGATVELNLKTYRPDQVPGVHVTSIGVPYVEAFERVKPRIGNLMDATAEWICSHLQAWFDATDLRVERILPRLILSSLELSPDGTATMWIEEPHLYDTGHSIQVGIDVNGVADYFNLA